MAALVEPPLSAPELRKLKASTPTPTRRRGTHSHCAVALLAGTLDVKEGAPGVEEGARRRCMNTVPYHAREKTVVDGFQTTCWGGADF